MAGSRSSSRASTASMKTRLNQVLSAPSYSKAGKSMRKLMKSAPSGENKAHTEQDDASVLMFGSDSSNDTSMRNIKQSAMDYGDADNHGDVYNSQSYQNHQSQREVGCIESKFQVHVPRKLGADRKSSQENDDSNNILDYNSIRNSRDGRRDDAFVSSPRSIDSTGMEHSSKQHKNDDTNRINEKRQEQFLQRTAAGRKILEAYLEKREKSGHEPSNTIINRSESNSLNQTNPEKNLSGSHYFKSTPRKDMVMKNDAPPIGRYNPKYDFVFPRPRTMSMGKTPSQKKFSQSLNSPSSMNKFPSPRDNFMSTNKSNVSENSAIKQHGGMPRNASATLNSPARKSLGATGASHLSNEKTKDLPQEQLTRKQKKEMKRYRDQVNRWVESRFGKEPAKGLSSLRSTTAQRNITSDIRLNDLTYWPASDPVKIMEKSKVLINMSRDSGRNNIGMKPMIIDPIYTPNHDIKYPRTTVGCHNMDGQCTRDSQMKTTRIGIESESGLRSKNDIGLHKFYDTDNAREQFQYKKLSSSVDLDKIVGREDPRNNYLLETETKALKTKGTALGGFEPVELLSTSKKLVQNFSFPKQVERKFQPGFTMHDLDYEPDYDKVAQKITYSMDFDATTERKFQPGFVLNDLMYYPKLDASSKDKRGTVLVNMEKDTTRSNNISAMMSRTSNLDPPIDVEYDKTSQQQLKLEPRVKGDPFLRKQLGRGELERIAKRLRGTTDIFYQVDPKVYDLVEPREIRSGNYDMQKTTNRYEKFENTMTKDSISQNRPIGGKQTEPPFVVRGQSGITLNDLSYTPKYDLVEERPTTHKIV